MGDQDFQVTVNDASQTSFPEQETTAPDKKIKGDKNNATADQT